MAKEVSISFVLIALFSLSCDSDSTGSPDHNEHGEQVQTTADHESSSGGVWTCPMCPGILESAEGICPRCKMKLTNTKVKLMWVCLKHPITFKPEKTYCSFCELSLKPVTMAVIWYCPDHDKVKKMKPGKCPECHFDLEEGVDDLPHGDHNSRHGGQFFMAPDNWHHLEGTLPAERNFRVYLYDDFTQALTADNASGKVEFPESTPSASGEKVDELEDPPMKTLPLAPSANGEYLELTLPAEDFKLPFEITAFLSFKKSGDDEHRFDFRFAELTTEEKIDGAIQALAQKAGTPSSRVTDRSALSMEELAIELVALGLKVRVLVAKKKWTDLYLPVLEAKDVALELESEARQKEVRTWEGSRRRDLSRGVRDVVRGAWLMELHGDEGNGLKVKTADDIFRRGVESIRGLFPSLR